jgi:hypothetical protein
MAKHRPQVPELHADTVTEPVRRAQPPSEGLWTSLQRRIPVSR